MHTNVHLGAVLRAVLLSTGAAILGGCANLPSPTPELAQFDPRQGYRFTQTARGADNTSSLLVVLTFSGGGTRAAALAHGILEELAAIDIEWGHARRSAGPRHPGGARRDRHRVGGPAASLA